MDLTLLLTTLGIIITLVIGAWQIYLGYKQIKNGEMQGDLHSKVQFSSTSRDDHSKPSEKKKNKLAQSPQIHPSTRRKTKEKLFLFTSETVVKFEIEATETMFYHAAKYKHEVGGTLIGVRTENEIHVIRTNIGFETDFTQIDLATGESIIGFWHSHVGDGVFISATDKSMLMGYPNLISVIIDPLSKSDTIAAYGIINKNHVRLKINKD